MSTKEFFYNYGENKNFNEWISKQKHDCLSTHVFDLTKTTKKRCWAIIHHPDRSGSQSFDSHLTVELKKVGNCFDIEYFRMHFNAIQLYAIFLHSKYFSHLFRIFFYNTYYFISIWKCSIHYILLLLFREYVFMKQERHRYYLDLLATQNMKQNAKIFN